jgi:HAD superfamily hydrolase (TIGR01484 family)
MIKLLILDVDNTLAQPGKPVDERIKQTLKNLESKKIKIVLISGKPIIYLSGLASQLGLKNTILCGENGACIYTSPRFPPKKQYIESPSKEENQILNALQSDILKTFKEDVWIQPNMVNLTIFSRSNKKLNDLERFIDEYPNQKVKQKFNIFKHSDAIDIVPSHINKGKALKKIMTIEGIKKSEVIAVGDGENDIPMFSEADISIGINLPKTQHNFPDIFKAMQFIEETVNRVNINE